MAHSCDSLTGKIALVTGAAGTIGIATAKLLAQRGAIIFAVDRRGADLGELRSALPSEAKLHFAAGDVTDEPSVAETVAKAVAECGRIDILFNGAGIEGAVSPTSEYPLGEFERVMAINVTGSFLYLKHVLPIMIEQKSGSVINMSSIAGLSGAPGMIGYTTSKHAVIGLTRSAGAEAAPYGVRVNCINPGPIESRMMTAIDSGRGPGAKRDWEALVPAKRYGTPEEVASMVAFLASDESSYSVAGVFTADGGLSAI